MSERDEHEFVTDDNLYVVSALWGRRAEQTSTIVKRWMSLISRLKILDNLFEKWEYYEEDQGFVPYIDDFDVPLTRARTNMEINTSGEIVDIAGTNLWLSNDFDRREYELVLRVRAGVDYSRGTNLVSLCTSMDEEASPRLLQYRIFRGVLLAAAETFDATHGLVWQRAIKDFWPQSGISETLDLAWMSYVSPRFAHLVNPPSNVIVEHRPDGGLFMAATDAVFRAANPTHLAAAQRIRDSLAAYNAVPWTKENGK